MRYRNLTFFGAMALLQSVGCGPSAGTSNEQPSIRTYNGTSACGFVQDDLGQTVTMVPKISFIVEKGFPEEFIPLIEPAMKVWNEALEQEVFSYQSGAELGSESGSESGAESGNQSLLRWTAQWPNDQKEDEAKTQIVVVGQKITKATISFNAQHFSYSALASEGKIDFKSVLVHELGHVLGLAHSEASDSVMQASLAKGIQRDHLGKSDYDHIACGLKNK